MLLFSRETQEYVPFSPLVFAFAFPPPFSNLRHIATRSPGEELTLPPPSHPISPFFRPRSFFSFPLVCWGRFPLFSEPQRERYGLRAKISLSFVHFVFIPKLSTLTFPLVRYFFPPSAFLKRISPPLSVSLCAPIPLSPLSPGESTLEPNKPYNKNGDLGSFLRSSSLRVPRLTISASRSPPLLDWTDYFFYAFHEAILAPMPLSFFYTDCYIRHLPHFPNR